MEINITLILQMMQFGFAYYFLYKFVFTPAYKLLDEKEEFKNSLYKNLEKEQQNKEDLLKKFYTKNNDFKAILIEAVPKKAGESLYQKTTCSITEYTVNTVDFSEQDRKKTEDFLINHLSQVIKNDGSY